MSHSTSDRIFDLHQPNFPNGGKTRSPGAGSPPGDAEAGGEAGAFAPGVFPDEVKAAWDRIDRLSVGDWAAEGPEFSNTGPSNRNLANKPPVSAQFPPDSLPLLDPISTGGCDWYDCTTHGHWEASAWERTREEMARAQKSAQMKDGSRAWFCGPEGEADIIQVEEGGAVWGCYCRFVVRWRGCRFVIVDSPEYSEHRVSVGVHLGSLFLMEHGLEVGWRMACDLLASLGYVMRVDKPTRWDACVDLRGADAGEAMRAFAAGKRVGRAKDWSTYGSGSKDTGFRIGKANVVLRVYDKSEEVKNDPLKRQVLEDRRWGGPLAEGETACRVEFQVRGELLRRMFSVSSTADLIRKQGDITRWLCCDLDGTETSLADGCECKGRCRCGKRRDKRCESQGKRKGWFRLTSVVPNRKNTEDFGSSSFWLRACQAFRSWAGRPSGDAWPMVRELHKDVRQLERGALGYLTSLAAELGVKSPAGIVMIVRNLVFLDPAAVIDDIKGKVVVRAGAVPGCHPQLAILAPD